VRRSTPSSPGLTRRSITLRKKMDARVKPAHDGVTILRRRDFVTFIAAIASAAAAWPLAARAQQPAMPVVGFLNSASPEVFADRLRAFHRGLKDAGFVEGENVAIVYRWAEDKYDRLPEFAAELVRRRVAVIAANSPAALPAKAATTSIPIVFIVAEDPVRTGLVTSLARPGNNLTGVNLVSGELTAKRLELLRELVPAVARIAVLVSPTGPLAETTLRDVEPAARAMGLQTTVLNASTSREIDAAFATFADRRPDALFVTSDPFFSSRRVQLANLASRHGIPMSSSSREIAEAGGLISYGSNIAEAHFQVGVYVGRILKGAKPADLPVAQSTKLELVINHQTARILGLTVPDRLLAIADEVIE
jgi:putative ABC transport system substrate-binding protein